MAHPMYPSKPDRADPNPYLDFGFAKLYDVDLAYKMAREAQRFLTAAEWN